MEKKNIYQQRFCSMAKFRIYQKSFGEKQKIVKFINGSAYSSPLSKATKRYVKMRPYNKLIIVSKTYDILDTSKKAILEAVADDCDSYLKELLGKEMFFRMNAAEEIKKEDGKIFYLLRQESLIYSEPS